MPTPLPSQSPIPGQFVGAECFWARTVGGCFQGLAEELQGFLTGACCGTTGCGDTGCVQASGYFNCADPLPCECSRNSWGLPGEACSQPGASFQTCGKNGCVECCPGSTVVPLSCPAGTFPFCTTVNEQTQCICVPLTEIPPPPPPCTCSTGLEACCPKKSPCPDGSFPFTKSCASGMELDRTGCVCIDPPIPSRGVYL
jgi:hypothetical protein